MDSDYAEKRYKLNRATNVSIKSKREKDSKIYRNTITVTYEEVGLEPLEFENRKQLETTIKAIDLEDEQLDLGV